MCGIAGYYGNCDESLSRLSDTLSTLRHRGPDGNGIYLANNHKVGLVHTRLAIQDLSSLGHQPMLSQDSSVAIIFNGEIYNFHELRKELINSGYIFKGNSDTEVLLALYLTSFDGSNLCPLLRRLNGIFAFSIWDSRCNKLWIARDASGVKPLYYSHSCGRFAFASELKALRLLADLGNDLDPVAVDRYLTFIYSPGHRCLSQAASKLGPGELILVDNGIPESPIKWSKDETTPVRQILSTSEAVSGTVFHLRRSVHSQMVSDVPLGAFLSGGLDSSAVVAFARELNPALECFTIDVNFDRHEGFCDDLSFSRKVAKHLNLPLHVVRVDPLDFASGLESMVWQLDEPLADPASLNVLFISQLARQKGIKVLLSGVGGDDLFTGYRRHHALQIEQYWRWLPYSIRLSLRKLTRTLPTKQPIFRRLRKAFSAAHLDGDERLVQYFRWIERDDLQNLYSDQFKSKLSQAQTDDPFLSYLSTLPSEIPQLERMLALERRFFLADHNLIYTDKMSMAAGVEVRVPFLDPELVEYSSRLSPNLKMRGHHSKWVLKKAMEPYLPMDVIYRPKTGFGVPLRSWLQYELRDWLLDLLSFDRLYQRGIFNPRAVHRLIKDNSESRIDASYTLLSLACIELWCTHFFDLAPSSTSPSDF